MELNEQNYYSSDADLQYMSHSQRKKFVKCEAAAMAELRGEYVPEKSVSFLVGSYVHSAMESDESLDKFKSENPEIISSQGATKGQLKSNFQVANKMIWTLNHDPLIDSFRRGSKSEVIVTGFWAGCWWKCKLDILNLEDGYIGDFKTASDLYEFVWVEIDGKPVRVSFIDAYGYPEQMATYSQIEMISSGRDRWLESYLTLVSSQDDPDKLVVTFSPAKLQDALQKVESSMPRILAVKSGQETPHRCERCPYCRRTKVLDRVVDFEKYFYGFSTYEE